MNFGKALQLLQQGDCVRLNSWKEDVFLELQIPDTYSKMTAPYIYVESRYGRVPWNPTQIELLSDEWEDAGP